MSPSPRYCPESGCVLCQPPAPQPQARCTEAFCNSLYAAIAEAHQHALVSQGLVRRIWESRVEALHVIVQAVHGS